MKGPVGMLDKRRESILRITTLLITKSPDAFWTKDMERTEVESLHENEVQMDPGVQEPIKSSGPRHPATLNVLYDLIIVPKAAQMSTMATVFTTGLCL